MSSHESVGARRARRSVLVFPADNRRMAEKAAVTNADAVLFDLEDGVSWPQKERARTVLRSALHDVDFGEQEVLVRVNPSGTADFRRDMEELAGISVDGVVLPKVETLRELMDAGQAVRASLGLRYGLDIAIESAKGFLNLKSIVEGGRGLVDSLTFGAGDFSAETGMSYDEQVLHYPRSHISIAASSAGMDCFDMVFPDIANLDGLAASSSSAAAMGYTGKWAIHPSQVDAINSAFSPTEKEVAWARRVVSALNAPDGSGVVVVDGAMVDRAVLPRAERILARSGFGP